MGFGECLSFALRLTAALQYESADKKPSARGSAAFKRNCFLERPGSGENGALGGRENGESLCRLMLVVVECQVVIFFSGTKAL